MTARIVYNVEKCSISCTKCFTSFYSLLWWCRRTPRWPILHRMWRNRSHPPSVFILALFALPHPDPSFNNVRCSDGSHVVQSSFNVCVRPSTWGMRRYHSTSLPRMSSSSMVFFSSPSSPLFSSHSSSGGASQKHSTSSGNRSTFSRSNEVCQDHDRSPSLGSLLNAVRFSPAYLRHAPSSQYYTLSNPVVENIVDARSNESPSCPSFSSFLRPSPYRHRILLLDDAAAHAPSRPPSTTLSSSPSHVQSPSVHGRRTEWEEKSGAVPLPSTSGVYLLSTTTADNMSFDTSFSPASKSSPNLVAAAGAADSRRAGGGALREKASTAPAHPVGSTLIGLPEVDGYASLQKFMHAHQSLLSTVRVVCLPEITLSTRRVLEVLFQQCFLSTHTARHAKTASSSSSSCASSFVEGDGDEDGTVQVWCSDFGKAFLLDDHFYTTVLKSVMEEESAMEWRYARHFSFGSGEDPQKNPGRTSLLSAHYQWLSLSSSPPSSSSSLGEGKGLQRSTEERAEEEVLEGGKWDASFRIPPASVHVVPTEGCTFDGCGARRQSSSSSSTSADTSIGKSGAGKEERTWRRPLQAVKLIEDATPPYHSSSSSSSSSSSASRRPAHYSNAPVFFYDPVFQGIFVGKSILRLPWLSPVLSSIAASPPETREKNRASLFFSQQKIPEEDGEQMKATESIRAKGVRFAATFPACKRCFPMPLFTHLHDAKRREGGGGNDNDSRSGYSRTSRHTLSSSCTIGDGRQGNGDRTALLPAVGPSPEVLGVRSCWDVRTFTDVLCRGLQSFPLPLTDPEALEANGAGIGRKSDAAAPGVPSTSSSCMRFLPPQRVLSAQFGEIPGAVPAVVAGLQESAKELTEVKKCFLNALFQPSPVRCEDEVERRRSSMVPTALALVWTTSLSDGGRTTHAKDVGRNEALPGETSCLPLTQQEAEEWSPFIEWCFPSYCLPHTLGSTFKSGECSTSNRATSAIDTSPLSHAVSGRRTLTAWGRMLECLWFSAYRLSSSPSFRTEMARMQEKRRRRMGGKREENIGKGEDKMVHSAFPPSSETSLPTEWCGKAGIALLNSIFCQKHLSGLCRVVNREEIDVQVFLSMTGEEIQKIFKPTFGLRKKIEGLQEEVRKKVQQVITENNVSEDHAREPKTELYDRAGTRDEAPENRFARGREQGGNGASSPKYSHASHHGSRNPQNFPTEKRPTEMSTSEKRRHSLRDRETPPTHYFGAGSASGITSI